MRLYAFLLAVCALARAATIPDNVAPSINKRIDVLPENVPDNESSEQELIDQANTINDVDNKLRVKPADIPVEVVLDNVALKAGDDSEEIVRTPIDLKNPGPPQRQEHETQNHEFDAAEQQIVQMYRENINEAQVALKQGFQGVNDDIQNMLQNNEQIQLVQQSIQSLRESFMTRINKLNDTIQSFLNVDNLNAVSPNTEQMKSNIEKVESGIVALRDDFTKGVNTLADGVHVFGFLRADQGKAEENTPSSPSSTATAPASQTPSSPMGLIAGFVSNLQNRLEDNLHAIQNGMASLFNQNQNATTTSTLSNTPQSDTPAPAPPVVAPVFQFPNFQNIFSNGPFQQQQQNSDQTNQQQNPPSWQNPSNWPNPWGQVTQAWQNFSNTFNGFLQGGNWQGFVPSPTPVTQTQKPETAQPVKQPEPQPEKPAEASKPDESKPEESKPDSTGEASAPAQAVGPIRQILQNNPISQGIAGAVHRLQNINNPDEPRDTEKKKADKQTEKVDNKPKGHPPGAGDNNDSTRVDDNEPKKEVGNETLPEEPKKEEKQTAPVVDKTD